jgi:hypothetical protein
MARHLSIGALCLDKNMISGAFAIQSSATPPFNLVRMIAADANTKKLTASLTSVAVGHLKTDALAM